MCAKGRRCAEAQLLCSSRRGRGPEDLEAPRESRSAATEKRKALVRLTLRSATLAYGVSALGESPPTAAVYGPHATPAPVFLKRNAKSRMKPGSRPNPKPSRSPNNAMERSRILVTDHAVACSAPSIRLAHLGR